MTFTLTTRQNAWTNENVDTRNIASSDVVVAIRDIQDTPPRFYDLPNIVRLTEDMKAVSNACGGQGHFITLLILTTCVSLLSCI
jgi:hypothetical protein